MISLQGDEPQRNLGNTVELSGRLQSTFGVTAKRLLACPKHSFKTVARCAHETSLTLGSGQVMTPFGYALSEGFMARLSARPNGGLPGANTELVTAPVPSAGLFPDLSATPPGDHSIGVFGGAANAIGDYSISYRLTFAVVGDDPAPVPLPASGLSILGGLSGLWAMRGRRVTWGQRPKTDQPKTRRKLPLTVDAFASGTTFIISDIDDGAAHGQLRGDYIEKL